MTEFERAITELVSDQESVAVNRNAIYTTSVEEEEVPRETLLGFLKFATPQQKERYESTKKILLSKGKAEFAIGAIDFEPVESFEVPENRLVTGTSTDTFIFKLYRPEEEREFESWSGDFTHSL
jgi:hypothetical protein